MRGESIIKDLPGARVVSFGKSCRPPCVHTTKGTRKWTRMPKSIGCRTRKARSTCKTATRQGGESQRRKDKEEPICRMHRPGSKTVLGRQQAAQRDNEAPMEHPQQRRKRSCDGNQRQACGKRHAEIAQRRAKKSTNTRRGKSSPQSSALVLTVRHS